MTLSGSTRRRLLISSGVTGALLIGIFGGTTAVAAVSGGHSSMTNEQAVDVPKPDPHYKKNSKGLTYGSAADAMTPDLEPDLILATATNGEAGYVLRKDLDDANGTTASKSFKSPEDALKWQANRNKADKPIKVYNLESGKVVGVFNVDGS